MSLLNFLTPRNVLSVLHLILGVFVFVVGIMAAIRRGTDETAKCDDSEQWAFMTIALLYAYTQHKRKLNII